MKKLPAFISVGFVVLISFFASFLADFGKVQNNTQMPTSVSTQPSAENTEAIIHILDGETAKEIKLDDYLVGVLLCEVPADFHPQAKMAQAVAARTYALRTAKLGIKHGYGVVCANPDCCQGFVSADEYVEKWSVTEPVDLAMDAVVNTRGRVITWNGELIDATYFSCSGGRTESAAAVWGSDVAYLQSIDSPGEEGADHYIETISYTIEEFCRRLSVDPDTNRGQWIGYIHYTEGGGIDEVEILGKRFGGVQLRSLLNLRSTDIDFTFLPDSVVISARGFGHRVGLSQYGADAMAKRGHSWQEIIHHYYADVEIE